MFAEVKRCIDIHDIKGLRYIFVDSLDVDPTFEKYRDDYEYCKKIPGFFEEYQELSEMTLTSSNWDMQYWARLKNDLMKNFSERRFDHMISVAQIVYAEKIRRLLEERKKKKRVQTTILMQSAEDVKDNVEVEGIQQRKIAEDPELLQNRRIEEEQKALDEENTRIDEEQKKQQERIREENESKESEKRTKAGSGKQNRKNQSKKVLGIVLAIIVVGVILLLRALR